MDIATNIIEIGRRMYARGLVAGTEGNISTRIDTARIACTPSGKCNGRLQESDICVVSPAGERISGTSAPSSEMPMHFAIYRADPAVG
ncbi:MAG: class II aldolase/adducin family protein, partial [Phycisphaerae bacterium]